MKAIEEKKRLNLTNWLFVGILPVVLSIALSAVCTRSSGLEDLRRGFVTPPRSARPNVMWWWLNSNISEEGVTRDLEEMKRQGIGGALIFDASPVDRWQREGLTQVPVGPAFMSLRWRELFRHALREADRLDVELGVSITSGFNAGGPWVTPEYGQQELVWSELVLEGPISFSDNLPFPAGPIYDDQGKPLHYQEMEINNDLARDDSGRPIHYRDVVLLALPVSDDDESFDHIEKFGDARPGRLKHWALKSIHSFDYPEDRGYRFETVYDDEPDIENETALSLEQVIDLTDRLDNAGHLDWQVPNGRWLLLRFGHTHTGVTLQATNPQNKGLAMDHLSVEAAERHFEEIASKMVEDMERVGSHTLKYLYLDSWEVRVANWTSGFREQFFERRGYDMTPYLPVLTGRIMDNREVSNRFLHDYRETVGDCIADHYFGAFRDLCHARGLEFRAEMATTPIPADMLKCLGRCDVPFGEFWMETNLTQGRVEDWERMFGKQASSAVHGYGSRLAAAEALTVIQKHWEHGPFRLKKTVDQAFCSGLNSLMIHTFTHSPPDAGQPGYEYFAGTHFNPQITWWDQAHAFTDYISRCQYLLQQGHFVADVCFYQGGEIPNFVPMKHSDPRLGPGYDYDVMNSEVLLTRLDVKGGMLVLPDGMFYRLLVLPEVERMDPDVLKKIEDLVEAGAVVVGHRPDRTYGLKDYPECDRQVKKIARRLWGDDPQTGVLDRAYGRGKVISGMTARDVLTRQGVQPDFEYEGSSEKTQLDYIHRSIPGPEGVEIYFIANLRNRLENVHCNFRITGKLPEIWDPATGEIQKATIYRIDGDGVRLPLRLPPSGSLFVLFRAADPVAHVTALSTPDNALFGQDMLQFEGDKLILQTSIPGTYRFTMDDTIMHDIELSNVPASLKLRGPWSVSFPQGWGAPDSVVYDELASWTESEDTGIKYFSGTATYSTTFDVDASYFTGAFELFLDLGELREVAEMTVNGEELGVLWKPPFRMNMTSTLKPGPNRLVVRVTNLWPNRLIGDEFLPEKKRFTHTNIRSFTAASPLIESGLLGPVRLLISKKMPVAQVNDSVISHVE